MVKNLRSRMEDSEFQRFKAIKARLGAETNDEALVQLMDFYQEHKGDTDDE